MKIRSITGIGQRADNQDVVCVEELPSNNHLLLIIDGMGGHEKGKEAAKIVLDRMLTFLRSLERFDQKSIQQAVQKANLGIKRFNKEHNVQSGAAVGGVIVSNSLAHIFWVGDVKIFKIDNGSVSFESKNHTLINSLIDNRSVDDKINLNKYRHILTRSISGKAKEAEIGYHQTEVNDILNIMRIQEMMKENNIEEFLSENAKDNYSLIYTKNDSV